MKKRRGRSYAKRVADINAIYDRYARSGLPNREIWKRYVWPVYGVSERTFYNLLKAPVVSDVSDRRKLSAEGFLFPDLFDDDYGRRDACYYKKDP